MKKSLAILLCLCLMFSLCACGGGGSEDPNAGVYQGVSASVMGFTMPMADVYPGETWVELKSGGKGTVTLDGDEFSMKWTLEGNNITISISGEDSVGTLENGAITIDFMNMGCIMVFEKEGGPTGGSSDSAQKSPESETAAAPSGNTDSALLGLYEGSTYEFAGQTYDMSALYETASTIELTDGSNGCLVMDGLSKNFTWTLDGESFVMNMDGVDSAGTLVNGVISIDLNGVGMMMNFVKAGAADEAPASPEEAQPAADENAGIADYETIAAAYDWLLDVNSPANGYQTPSYETIVEKMGGVQGAPARTDLWTDRVQYYSWSHEEGEFVQLTFRLDEGTWECSGYTNTTAYKEIYDKYIK